MKHYIETSIELSDLRLKPRSVRKFFLNMYRFLLYQDTEGLLKTLDYRHSLRKEDKEQEKDLVFRFMLRLFRDKHPCQLAVLCPTGKYSF